MKKSDDFCLQGNQRFPGPENPKFVRIFLVIKFEINLTFRNLMISGSFAKEVSSR